jgi:Cu(I)/Ag(I) efflux system membrane fusion protein
MKKYITWIVSGLLLLGIGYMIGSRDSVHSKPENHSSHGKASDDKKVWTCSMHPQIKLPKKGKCPICFMDLIPLKNNGTGEESDRVLKMTSASMKLAEIQTKKIERKESFINLELFGKVAEDTTRISDIAILADAEIRKLFVNYAGIPIKKGEHLAELYSPDVYTAGQDYLVALESNSIDNELVESSVTKLKLLGVPQDYIDSIEKSRVVPETYTLKSPIDGFVKNQIGYQGMWVKKGQMLCRIIDLSSLWVNLDVYESDLAWIRYGQDVIIKAEAVYGHKFNGVVSYIPPELDNMTRTIKVRVNVDNSKNLLKPNMFISANLKAKISDTGYVTSSKLKGKWISPMHPEIIKDEAGECDVCGMNLVRAEELGFQFGTSGNEPLLVPSSAVLITGKRAVVYVKLPTEEPLFEGREIEIGPKVNNSYVVLSGLKEGDRVVVKGGFKIDSALQIQAKPSMMSVQGGESLLNKKINESKISKILNSELKESLSDFMDYYFKIQSQLSSDQNEHISHHAKSMFDELEYADYSTLKKNELEAWKNIENQIKDNLNKLSNSTTLKSERETFKETSKIIINLINLLGHNKKGVYQMYCSMVDSNWLQLDKKVANPYYGKSMLRCGELKKTLPVTPNKK